MSELKKYKVSIFGQTYVLSSDEPESRLIASAQLVDTAMKQISHSAKITDSNKIAVLVALQLASKNLAALEMFEKQDQYKSRLLDILDQEVL